MQRVIKAQLQHEAHTAHTKDKLGALSSGDQGHLLHMATLPSLGDVAALPNTEKQTPEGSQNEETKKPVPNERKKQTPRKTTKQNGDKQSTKCRVQNTGYKVLNDFNEKFNTEIGNIKMGIETFKKQSEINNTITEVKKTLEGINSILDEAEDQISNLEDRLKKTPNQNNTNKRFPPPQKKC